MSHTLILADDMTGAADSTAPFVRRGLTSVLCLDVDGKVEADVFSVVTHSRLSSAQLAVEQHKTVLQEVKDIGLLDPVQWVYHKIDSTLRGYPAQTLNATMDMTGFEKALVTPAFPEQGRITQNGRVFLNGKPLADSEFGDAIEGDDLIALFKREARPVVPITLSCIREGRAVDEMHKHDAAIFVADAETQSDLADLAKAALQSDIRLLCGSAGLAGGLALLCDKREADDVGLPNYEGPIFAVSGSQHPIMVEQVQRAKEDGVDIVPVQAQTFPEIERWMHFLTTESRQILAGGSDVVMTTVGLDIGPQSALISDAVGTVVKDVLDEVAVGGLFLTGGNIAEAVCNALGVSQFLLMGQIEDGVVLGRFMNGSYPGMFVVTKAGGFGHGGTMLAAIKGLRTVRDAT